jgi:hypothetical protein
MANDVRRVYQDPGLPSKEDREDDARRPAGPLQYCWNWKRKNWPGSTDGRRGGGFDPVTRGVAVFLAGKVENWDEGDVGMDICG